MFAGNIFLKVAALLIVPLVAIGVLFSRPPKVLTIAPLGSVTKYDSDVALLPVKATSSILVPTPPAVTSPATSSVPKKEAPSEVTKKVEKPAPTEALPSVITGDWLLGKTTNTLKQKLDGTSELLLDTDLGNGTHIGWGLADTGVGGTGLVPRFDASYTCSPFPDFSINDADQKHPYFKVRTSYHCTMSLTPSSGSDKRTQSKVFSFETGPGKLIVTPPLTMSSLLKDGKNESGFVFDNQDDKPLTITKLTIDISFTALNTASTPLVVRFLDPKTELSIFDYHAESLPADSSDPHTQSGTNAEVPLSFTLGAHSQKMLPVQMVGVSKLNIAGVNPAITVIVRSVTTDSADVGVVLRQSQISWTCITPTEAYNPLATSSIFMTGQACRD